jgi:hypothetical protein
VAAAVSAGWTRKVPAPTRASSHFPGWPETFAGDPLVPQDLGPAAQRFAAGFPGRLGFFRAGATEVVLRWVDRPTRRLHPAAHCLRGLGFVATPAAPQLGPRGHAWGHLEATRDGEAFSVRERLWDNRGNSWTDVSAWFWATLSGRTEPPWWSAVVIEPKEKSP